MATEKDYQALYDRIAALRDTVTGRMASDLISNPQLADALTKQIDDLLQGALNADLKAPLPPDKGLAELAGIGPQAATEFGKARIPQGVEAYDETITSERIIAVGDLYYLYQHEKIGVFKVVQKLQELFRAGTVRFVWRSGRVRALPIRSSGSTSLHHARSHSRLPQDPWVWLGTGAGGFAPEHRLPQAVFSFHPSGDPVLAR